MRMPGSVVARIAYQRNTVLPSLKRGWQCSGDIRVVLLPQISSWVSKGLPGSDGFHRFRLWRKC